MYQSVSSATCCSPFDWELALIAQMLNQPAFLTVPSGFSRISNSFLGILSGIVWPWLAGADRNSGNRSAYATNRTARIQLMGSSGAVELSYCSLNGRDVETDEQQKTFTSFPAPDI